MKIKKRPKRNYTYRNLFDNGFKTRLDYLMKENNVSDKELATFVGATRQSIFNWRYKDLNYPLETKYINKICKMFNVKSQWLMKGFR